MIVVVVVTHFLKYGFLLLLLLTTLLDSVIFFFFFNTLFILKASLRVFFWGGAIYIRSFFVLWLTRLLKLVAFYVCVNVHGYVSKKK